MLNLQNKKNTIKSAIPSDWLFMGPQGRNSVRWWPTRVRAL